MEGCGDGWRCIRLHGRVVAGRARQGTTPSTSKHTSCHPSYCKQTRDRLVGKAGCWNTHQDQLVAGHCDTWHQGMAPMPWQYKQALSPGTLDTPACCCGWRTVI
jgi:hypothetical protein